MPAVGENFAQYRLDEQIQGSSTSTTDLFRALDTEGGLEVVIEIVRDTASSVEKARFATRARRLSQIRQPSLRSVLDVGPTHCAFEAPAGPLLSEHTGVAISRARQKLQWLAKLAPALFALHQHGIAHGHLSLADVVILPDLGVKLAIPLGGETTASPLDDIRALGRCACVLLLADPCTGATEQDIMTSLTEAGVPGEAAALLARITVGPAMTSEDLATKLGPFADYTGPSTEPLLPVAPRRSSP